MYEVRGFSRKNREVLSDDLQDLLKESSSPWLRQNSQFIFPHAAAGLRGRASSAPPSLDETVALGGYGDVKRACGERYASDAGAPLYQPRTNSASIGRARPGRKKQASVGEQFRAQLGEL